MAQTDNTTTPNADTRIITLTQLNEHNTQKDLWISVHGKVYNLTSFAHDHPGGIDVLTDNAGLDGTETFDYAGHGFHQLTKMKRYQTGVLPASQVNDAAGSKEIKLMQQLSVTGNGKSSIMTTSAGNALRNVTLKLKQSASSSSNSNWPRLLASAICALLTLYLLLQRGLSTTTGSSGNNDVSRQRQQQQPDFQLTPARAFYTGLIFASSLSCAGVGVLYTKFTATTKYETDVFAYPPVIPRRKI